MQLTLIRRLSVLCASGLLVSACGDDGSGNDWDASLERATVIETEGHFAVVEEL